MAICDCSALLDINIGWEALTGLSVLLVRKSDKVDIKA